MIVRSFLLGAGLVVAMSFAGGIADARDLTAAERHTLSDTITKLSQATTANDMTTIVGLMPPKLIAVMAKQSNVTPDALRHQMASDAAGALKQMKIDSAVADLGDATYPDTKGAPVAVLIPTETVVELGARKISSKSTTLAILDGGAWYLLGLSKPDQMQVVAQAYPEFAGLKTPAPSAVVVQ